MWVAMAIEDGDYRDPSGELGAGPSVKPCVDGHELVRGRLA
jgi:hypothetical protein